jgi:hypothetical protein
VIDHLGDLVGGEVHACLLWKPGLRMPPSPMHWQAGEGGLPVAANCYF